MRSIRSTTLAVAAATFLLAGCGDDVSDAVGSLADAVQDDAAESEPEADPDAAADEVTDTDLEAGNEDPSGDTASIAERAIDETVFWVGLEYTVQRLTVVDLDAGSDERVQGVELVFDTSVFNTGSDTAVPAPPVSLRWDVPGTDDVIDVTGRTELRQVPANASSSGEIIIPLTPDDLVAYDDASARLVIGRSGQSAAQVPVGADAELISRLPVPQPVEGTTLEVGDVLVTITAAEVRYDPIGSPSHLEDGAALLELTYDMENRGGNQSCSRRGEGRSWFAVLPDGDSVVDLGVSERCVGSGMTETGVVTGLVIDADYAGEYTIRHEREGDVEGEATLVLVDAPGVAQG